MMKELTHYFEETIDPMKQFRTEFKKLYGGIQKIYRFDNGYGASVIQHKGSYGFNQGLWEIAVLNADNELDYSTEIASDVIGRLNDFEIVLTLKRIQNL